MIARSYDPTSSNRPKLVQLRIHESAAQSQKDVTHVVFLFKFCVFAAFCYEAVDICKKKKKISTQLLFQSLSMPFHWNSFCEAVSTMTDIPAAIGDKLWGGRFTEKVDCHLDELNSSVDVDKRMYEQDIEGSIAYARALINANLLGEDEGLIVIDGLRKIKIEWDEGRFVLCSTDEDIHTAVERRLTELIGSNAAGKLHTGRSRNDQTVTDTRLWLRKSIDEILEIVINTIETFVNRADDEKFIFSPGYTHLQRAQPVRWSHWLLSHAWNLKNDYARLVQIRERVNVMPLGSGALAGNPFDIDRSKLAENLGFSSISDNSMQAVGDRDFVAEYLFWASLISVHLSRLAEDLIIYSSSEFNFIRFSDGFSTGSSLMPQKRNPDCMELVRGKTGTVLGKCIGFMVTLKGIPSTYNKDLQEDKEALFSSHDTLINMLRVTEGAIRTLQVEGKNCQAALETNMLATDVAYYLVRKGVPFREAHHVAGKVVARAESLKVHLQEISLHELKSISQNFEADIASVWNFEKSVEQYKVHGGTSSTSVKRQIDDFREWLNDNRRS